MIKEKYYIICTGFHMHLNLQYKFKDFAFGVQYGIVDFVNGIQGGNNVSFFVEIPTTIRAGSYADAQKEFTVTTSNDEFWKKPAVKSVQQIKFDWIWEN